MIPKPFEEIDVAALQALIDNGVSESKTIEYKSKMRERVEEFVADVSAFANTAGGDLIIGVEEDKGVPTGFPGVEIDDPDGECIRLDQMLQNGLEPRLPRVDIKSIQVSEGRYVLVIRAHKSWNSPHRVKKNRKFHIRKSAGRDELDVGELRSAFTLSETVADRIRDFRTDRIAKIYSDETPVPLMPGGRMILHILPLSAFTEGAMIDLATYRDSPNPLPLIDEAEMRIIGSRGFDGQVNLDGIVLSKGHDEESNRAYTQLFRTGAVESVKLLEVYKDRALLYGNSYELRVVNFLKHYIEFAVEFSVEIPYYVFLSFISTDGFSFIIDEEMRRRRKIEPASSMPDSMWMSSLWHLPLKRKTLILSEVVIEDRDTQLPQILRPVFDMVWNAFGFIRSFNFDEQGNWID